MSASPAEVEAGPISSARKWAITLSVMVVAFMQVLDTSVTNVVLPHLQGSLSAGLEEVSWVITSYLAANAIIIPATGWLAGVLGRKRFFLICCVLFTVSSVLSGMAPNLTFLILARIAQGIGGGPIIPLSQAILWEIFPLGQRGLAMAVWGVGLHDGADHRADARAATSRTTGRGAGSSTSTCRSGCSASSWPAPSCSIRRISGSRAGWTGPASC